MCNFFGGPTSDEEMQSSKEASYADTLNANYNTEFAGEQAALGQLNTQIGRIESGNTGAGMSPAEYAARQSGIIANAGAEGRNAAQAAQDLGAGHVFGGQSDSSGLNRGSAINKQVTASLTGKAEADKANALNNLTSQNFELGRSNALAAEQGYDALAGKYGSQASSLMTGVGNARTAALDSAHMINVEKQQKAQAIGKLVTSVALGAATFGMGGIGALGAGESFGEGAKDFLSGGFNALSGQNTFGVNPGGGGGGNSDQAWNLPQQPGVFS